MLLQQYIVKIQLCMPGIAHLFKILQYTTEQMCDLGFFQWFTYCLENTT